ncbi:MAG: MBL fold metallo-hydrolase [Clostridia bacterium]|nr:MBL fold metallo-hydrolase [Clostridia bacterium]
MNVKTVNLGVINENCYLISSDSAAIIVDPGYYSDEISDFLKNNSDKHRIILLTHCHFDHIGAANKIAVENGVKIAIGKLDADGLHDPRLNLSASFRAFLEPFKADILLENNEEFSVGDIDVKVIFTPGHTVGSVCYLIGGALFSGDTLFYESYGRTDFPGGSEDDMQKSFYYLTSSLPADTKVYPGHDCPTTISHEIDYNPIGYMNLL